jgi:hypothetical protein
VKAAVERVFILPLAIRAHLENGHGGEGAVIGDVLDDSEAWAATGTVGERIMETAVARGKDIVQARLTGGYVGRDELVLAGCGNAMADLKTFIPGRRVEADGYIFYPCQRRGFILQFRNKEIEGLSISLDLDLYIL